MKTIFVSLLFFSIGVLPIMTALVWLLRDNSLKIISLLEYFFTETMQGGLVILFVFCFIIRLFLACIGKFFAKLERDPKNTKVEHKIYSAIATALEVDR